MRRCAVVLLLTLDSFVNCFNTTTDVGSKTCESKASSVVNNDKGEEEACDYHEDSLVSSSSAVAELPKNQSNGLDLGVEQLIEASGDLFHALEDRLQMARSYMSEDVMKNDSKYDAGVRESCRNYHPECTQWAVEGECEKNSDFMLAFCAPVCFSCEMAQVPVNENQELIKERDSLLRALGADLGAVQLTRGHFDGVVSLVEESRLYIQEVHPELRDFCFLRHVECALWALQGRCNKNDGDDFDQNEMIELCAPVCKACDLSIISTGSNPDTRPSEAEARARALGSNLGVIQEVWSDQLEALEIIEEGRVYKKQVLGDPTLEKVRDLCINRHESCTLWSIGGECDANPLFMQLECPVACKSCDQLEFEIRCRPDPNATDALRPWDLNSLFERILTDPQCQQYEPVALSRPWYSSWDTQDNATYKLGLWLVQFENVLTNEEAEHLIELGEKRGYEPSEVTVDFQAGQSVSVSTSTRTSFNTWCQDDCYEDPVYQRMLRLIENMTGIPESNYEYAQMTRYSPGQYYSKHDDYISEHQRLPMGPRILTFYVYLNSVEKGGGTEFPDIGLTVQPKPGRAVLWPSVLAEFPTTIDPRSRHAALPVIKGVKYGLNLWIHLRNFKSAYERWCT